MNPSESAIYFPSVADANDNHQDVRVSDDVDDHVIFAGMDATEIFMALQLPRPLPTRVFGQEIEPAPDASLNVAGKLVKFLPRPRRKDDSVWHGSKAPAFP